MTAAELLHELNTLDETSQIEAKVAREIGKATMETVCGFANEPGLGGGYLLLGVKATASLFEPVYEVVGIDDPDKIQCDLATQCASMFNIPIRPEIWVERIDNKHVVGVHVQEAQPSEKPVFLKGAGLPGGAVRRVGSTDQRCTEDDLIVLYAGRQAETYDATIIPDGTLSDIDADAITDYRRARGDVNPNAEELAWPDEDLLKAFACAREHDGQLRPTVAGILLFGTPMAIRRCFPMMRLDYIRVPGKEWVEDPTNRFETVEIRAPLLTAVRRTQAAILDDLLKAFSVRPGDLQRKERPIVPSRVIREAVVNAVMHRNYCVHGAIQVLRYSNRLEIRNPGHSLIADDKLGQPGSETRNPKIAAVLHETGLAETKGSGIRVMRQMMRDTNLTPPTFESSRVPDRFVATFLFHHFLAPEDMDWLAQMQAHNLSDHEAMALIFVREAGAVNNAAYRDINQTDTLDASTHLRRLRESRLLEKKGKGSLTYYVPGPAFPAAESAKLSGESTKLEGESTKLEGESAKLEGESAEPAAGSADQAPGLVSVDDLPGELRQELAGLGKRPQEKVLRDVIVRLCCHQVLTAPQLAHLLGRQRQALVRGHLAPMIQSGQLVYLFPDTPLHPNQAYRAASERK